MAWVNGVVEHQDIHLNALLIEDNPADARLMEELLREQVSYLDLTHNERLEDGLKALKKSQFDVVVLDLDLPDSKGYETIKRVRAQSAATPIVVLSGRDESAEGLSTVIEGAQDFLSKNNMADGILFRRIQFAIERMAAVARQNYTTISNANGKIKSEIEDLVGSLEATGGEVHSYGDTMQSLAGQLKDGIRSGDLQTLVQHLATAARQMNSITSDLESRLEDSSSTISELSQELETTFAAAMTDELTQLANRKAMDESLEQAISRTNGSDTPLSIFISDIDHFKSFNDTWGHQTGDEVLRLVGKSLSQRFPSPMLPARYGGEEFVVIMEGTSDSRAAELAESLRSHVASQTMRKRVTNESLGQITLSLGVATLETDESAESLISRADAALYRAKRQGRNRVELASSTI